MTTDTNRSIPMPEIAHPTGRPNFTRVDLGALTLYFSYRTCVAFHTPDAGTVVRENKWGPTTGKHLNYLDDGDKAARLGAGDFARAVGYALDQAFA